MHQKINENIVGSKRANVDIFIIAILIINSFPTFLRPFQINKLDHNNPLDPREILDSTPMVTPIPQFSSDFTPYGPLNLSSNTDLQLNATHYGWQGDGSMENPIIIENGNFSSVSASEISIYLGSTSLFVQVNNCIFSGAQYGIICNNTKNININNCSFRNLDEGVYGVDVENLRIQVSIFQEISTKGINLVGGKNIQMNNNSFSDMFLTGILANPCQNMNITDCEFYRSPFGLIAGGEEINISYSDFHLNGVGIDIYNTATGEISECIFMNNTEGMVIGGENQNFKIFHNSICYSTDDGMRIFHEGNEIYENNFIHNDFEDHEIFTYGRNEGNPGWKLNLYHNFETSIYGEDKDFDGIMDPGFQKFYYGFDDDLIDIENLNPLIRPYPVHREPHLLNRPYLNVDTSVLDLFDLRWTNAFDSFDYPVNYDLFYSTVPEGYVNGPFDQNEFAFQEASFFTNPSIELNWTLLETNLAESKYSWKDPNPHNFSYYFFKVVANSEGNLSQSVIENSASMVFFRESIEDKDIPYGWIIGMSCLGGFLMITSMIIRKKRERKAPSGTAMLD